VGLAECEESLQEESAPVLRNVVSLVDHDQSDITQGVLRILTEGVHETFGGDDVDVRFLVIVSELFPTW
jgi:hypothetical protein